LLSRPPPTPPPFPYTTLFRSHHRRRPVTDPPAGHVRSDGDHGAGDVPAQDHREPSLGDRDGPPGTGLQVDGVDRDRGHLQLDLRDRKSTRLNSSHQIISYAVF